MTPLPQAGRLPPRAGFFRLRAKGGQHIKKVKPLEVGMFFLSRYRYLRFSKRPFALSVILREKKMVYSPLHYSPILLFLFPGSRTVCSPSQVFTLLFSLQYLVRCRDSNPRCWCALPIATHISNSQRLLTLLYIPEYVFLPACSLQVGKIFENRHMAADQ